MSSHQTALSILLSKQVNLSRMTAQLVSFYIVTVCVFFCFGGVVLFFVLSLSLLSCFILLSVGNTLLHTYMY